jgi:hypothetical protein
VLYTVVSPRNPEISGFNLIVVFVCALYNILRTFYLLIYYHKRHSLIFFGGYITRFSATAFSLFNFQTSFLTYTDLNRTTVSIMNLLSGALVSVSVFTLAAISVTKSNRKLKVMERTM